MRHVTRTGGWLVMALLLGAVGITAYRAKAADDDKPSLAGKTWAGDDSDGDHYVFTFQEDGVLAYTSPTGSFTNGKWWQHGNAVYFQMNDHFSEYLGEIVEGKMTGMAWNKKDVKWTWEAAPKE